LVGFVMDKDFILSEINRTATENDGKPLGMGRFFAETGIHRRDWLGRYWARWSEALQEADLEPNAFGAEGLSEAELLLKLAKLTRKLGRIPAKAEIMLEHRLNGRIPNPTVYQRRFGDKRTEVSLLRTFCIERVGYEDVASLCDAYLGSRNIRADTASGTDGKEEQLGFVYLIKMGRYYKIGKTNSVGRRERELAIQLPEASRRVHQISTDDPSGIETYWHNRFRDRRANGEFFALTQADVAAFKRRKFM
jgi:hypothetical protein